MELWSESQLQAFWELSSPVFTYSQLSASSLWNSLCLLGFLLYVLRSFWKSPFYSTHQLFPEYTLHLSILTKPSCPRRAHRLLSNIEEKLVTPILQISAHNVDILPAPYHISKSFTGNLHDKTFYSLTQILSRYETIYCCFQSLLLTTQFLLIY